MESKAKKVAVEFEFNPAIRVCVSVPTDKEYTNKEKLLNDVYESAQEILLKKLQSWTKEEIIDWVLENEAGYDESYEVYNKEYDED